MGKRAQTVFLSALGVFLGLSTSIAETPQNESASWFEGLDQAAKFTLQTSLVLTANYDGLIDGEYGAGTYSAIQAFERSIGSTPDGILDPREMQLLEDQAAREFNMLGIEATDEPNTQLSFPLAKKLFVDSEQVRGQTVYKSADKEISLTIWSRSQSDEQFEATFGKAVTAGTHRTIVYSKLSDDRFTVTGTSDASYFYTRGIRGEGRTVGFSLQYDPRYRTTGGILAGLMASLSTLPGDSRNSGSGGSTEKAGVPEPGSQPQQSSGSGFFVSSDGTILTNFHVAGTCSTLTVPHYGSANLLRGDREADLAVIQLDQKVKTPWARIRKTPVHLAESVVLAGYPLADILSSALNVSTGVVSSVSGLGDNQNWFTTNAGIQPGNSGGPILDSHGDVVGVAVAKINDVAMLQEKGTVASNVGFGIKTDDVLTFLAIFDHSEVDEDVAPSLKPEAIAEKAKSFTVQVLCSEK